MKFLVLALCVCAASAASLGQYQGFAPSFGFNPGYGSSSFNPGYGSSSFNPGYGSSSFNPGYGSRAVAAAGAPFQSVASATASAGAPALYAAKAVAPVATPVAYTANAVAQTAAVPFDVAFKTVTPVVAPAEYTANADAQVVATPVEYNTNAVVRNVAAPFVTAAKVVATPAVAAVNLAKNLYRDNEATIVRSESNIEPTGYSYSYETNNGISANSAGELKKVGDVDVLAIRGSYAYTANDGTPVVLTYIADENGYQPQSDIIPVGPAIPEAIVRSLAYIAAHPYTEKVQKY